MQVVAYRQRAPFVWKSTPPFSDYHFYCATEVVVSVAFDNRQSVAMSRCHMVSDHLDNILAAPHFAAVDRVRIG